MDKNNKINIPLTDEDLEKSLGIKSDKILKYSELKDYQHIDELLPSIGSFRIILIEDSYNRGHWVCIIRGAKEYYFFDAYGGKYDTQFKWINRMTRLILGQSTNELTRLFRDIPNDWNKIKLQGNKSQVCGRWCILACIYCGKLLYSMKEFIKMIKDKKKELGCKSFDEVALKLTEKI